MKTPKVEFCYVLKGFVNHPLMAEIVNVIKSFDDKALHRCPYTVFEILNKPITVKNLKIIFPQGDYKMFFNFTLKNGEKLYDIELMISWISSERNSFG